MIKPVSVSITACDDTLSPCCAKHHYGTELVHGGGQDVPLLVAGGGDALHDAFRGFSYVAPSFMDGFTGRPRSPNRSFSP